MRHAVPALVASLLVACSAAAPAQDLPFTVTPVADLESPWAMTFLPDGRMLVTEKAGKLLLLTQDGQSKVEVSGVPAVDARGQGGLLDVAVSPGFARDRMVYLSYAEAGEGTMRGVVLARGTFSAANGQARLENVQPIFRGTKADQTGGHFSGRIAFSPDGKYLFFTNGDRQKFDPAQDPKSSLGKVHRLLPDGKPAPGNPLAAKGFLPTVWSYGHRNLLGLAFDARGNLWEQEMGPKGGDEVNLVLAGRNYGYPIASNGSHYDGPPLNGKDIPDHKPGDGFEAPKVWWNPSISPGGLMVYTGNLFPQWKGDVFVGGLSSQALLRIDVNGTNATKGDQWPMGQRIREVEQGPDGAIWLLEDGTRGATGRVLKLTPKG